MSALLLKQRPIDLSSPLEVFMVARIRGAQVSHSSEALVVYLLTAKKKAPSIIMQSPAVPCRVRSAFSVFTIIGYRLRA